MPTMRLSKNRAPASLAFLLSLAILATMSPCEVEAQGDVLFVKTDKVGIGTANPQSTLHIEREQAEARVTSTGAGATDHASLVLKTTGGTVQSEFTIRTNATTGALEMKGPTGGAALKFRAGAANNSLTVGPAGAGDFARVGIGTANPAGALDAHTLDVNGAIYQRGSSLHADYVFDAAYELESIEEHSQLMWTNRHLPAIPPRTVDENGLEVIELGAHRRGLLEELEKAHIYIAQLHEVLTELRGQVRVKDETLADLEDRLSRIERQLQ